MPPPNVVAKLPVMLLTFIVALPELNTPPPKPFVVLVPAVFLDTASVVKVAVPELKIPPPRYVAPFLDIVSTFEVTVPVL